MRFIPDAVTRKAALALLKTQKHSPTILFATGVAGVVATAVLASRATLHVDEVLDEHNDYVELFESAVKDKSRPDYTAEVAVRDKALLFVKTGLKLGKLYAPSLAAAAITISCLAGSHKILTRRNAALTAAYAAIEKGFSAYRERVVEDAGEEKDREYLYGLEKEKVTVTDEDGKKKRVEKTVATKRSPYGVLFHEGNPNWNKLPEYNFFFLRCQQRILQQQLASRGYLFLSDVYMALGFPETPASRVVGWLYESDNPNSDGYVDFGIFDRDDIERVHDFIQGREGELYLDFNVDGPIYEDI